MAIKIYSEVPAFFYIKIEVDERFSSILEEELVVGNLHKHDQALQQEVSKKIEEILEICKENGIEAALDDSPPIVFWKDKVEVCDEA